MELDLLQYIIASISTLLFLVAYIKAKQNISINIVFIVIFNGIILFSLDFTSKMESQNIIVFLGLLVLIFGLSSISIKEVRNIEISVPEYILISIVLGMALYQYLGQILYKQFVFESLIPLIAICFILYFITSFVNNLKKLDRSIVLSQSFRFWNAYSLILYSMLVIVVGLIGLIYNSYLIYLLIAGAGLECLASIRMVASVFQENKEEKV